MASVIFIVIALISASAMAGHGPKGGPPKAIIPGGDTINISGIVLDSHKEPIDEANIKI